jgi:hypothetical protein
VISSGIIHIPLDGFNIAESIPEVLVVLAMAYKWHIVITVSVCKNM